MVLTMVNLEQKLMEFGELFLAAMRQSSLEQGTLDAGGNKDNKGGEGGSRGAGASPLGSMRPETPALLSHMARYRQEYETWRR